MELQGGDFGNGFIAAGLAAPLIDQVAPWFGGGDLGEAIASILVGGTLSEVTGGSFVNGAAYSAFRIASLDVFASAFSARFGPEGTAEMRRATFEEAKRLRASLGVCVENVRFIDTYAIGTLNTETGGFEITYADDIDRAKVFILSAGANQERGFVLGSCCIGVEGTGFLGFFQDQEIYIYRAGVVGLEGNLPGIGRVDFSELENAIVEIGHEISHRRGVDRLPPTQGHLNSNRVGVGYCRQLGMCGD